MSVIVHEVCSEILPEWVNEVTQHPGSTVFFSWIANVQKFVCLRYSYITALIAAICCGSEQERMTIVDGTQQFTELTSSPDKVEVLQQADAAQCSSEKSCVAIEVCSVLGSLAFGMPI